jgi:LPS sulfotransferase NodH
MEPTYGRGSIIDRNDPRQVNIGELTNRLSYIIQTITRSGSDERITLGLASLISEGAIFGYHLFITQPSEWTFDWSRPRSDRTQDLILYPAMLKTIDDQGQTLSTPELKVPVTLFKGM